MKLIQILSRLLLGALMLASGLNKLLPKPFMEVPSYGGDAGDFMKILAKSGYLDVVGGLEVIGGVFLVTGFFVPLGLVLVGPVVVNIVLFHLLVERGKWDPIWIGTGVLFLLALLTHLGSFGGVLRPIGEKK